MLALATMCVSAQSFGDVPATVDPNDVTILKKNVLVIAEHDSIVALYVRSFVNSMDRVNSAPAVISAD